MKILKVGKDKYPQLKLLRVADTTLHHFVSDICKNFRQRLFPGIWSKENKLFMVQRSKGRMVYFAQSKSLILVSMEMGEGHSYSEFCFKKCILVSLKQGACLGTFQKARLKAIRFLKCTWKRLAKASGSKFDQKFTMIGLFNSITPAETFHHFLKLFFVSSHILKGNNHIRFVL